MLQALYHGVWADNSLPGKVIVLIILGLLCWALQAGSRHRRRYSREEDDLSKLIEQLGKVTAQKAPSPEGGETGVPESGADQFHVSPADLAVLRQELRKDSLIAERLEAIEKLRTRQVRINPSALQQLSLARDEARPGMAVPGAVASLATMLGLLGTFIGLAVMVQQIQFVLPQSGGSVDTWVKSAENLSGILGGIKTAFSASLVGIVSSIFASVANFRLRAAQALFFERMERFTTEDLLPAAVPAVEDESLLDRVSLQMENSFSRLDEIYRQNQDALKEMTGAQSAFVAIVKEVREITRSEASRNLEGVLEQVSQANKSVLSVAQQLPKIVTVLESGQRRLLDKVASILAAKPEAFPAKSGRPTTSWGTTLIVVLVALLLASIVFFRM